MSLEKLLQTAEIVEVRGNRPLALNRTDQVWLVTRGSVDIFVSQIRQGQAYGRKTHIMRLNEGEIFFGSKADGISLQASGNPDTRCAQLDLREFFAEVERSELVEYIDGWLVNLSAVITGNLRPRSTERIELVRDFELSREQSISARHKTVWLKVKSGKTRLLDAIDSDQLGLLPLTRESWIVASEKSLLDSFSLEEFFAFSTFVDDLDNFNRSVFNSIKKRLQQEKEEAFERLEKKTANRLNSFVSSLDKIRRVILPPKRRTAAALEAISDNYLLSALKIVGNYLKIKIVSHPDDNSQMENILRASKVKSRKIVLQDDWWNFDSGPMVCFLKEDKRPVPVLPVSPGKYEYLDLKENRMIRITARMADDFEPFGFTLYRPFPARKMDGWSMLKFGMQDCGRDLAMVLIIGVAGALLGLLTPIFTGIIFDSVIPEAAIGQLWQMAFILLSCAVTAFLFELTKATAILRIEGKVDYSLQAAIWDRLISLPAPFFRNYSSGDLAMRSMGIDAIRQILSGVTVQAILAFIFSFFYWGLLFYYNVNLAIIATILGTVMIMVTFSCGYLCVKYQRKINDMGNHLSGMVLQFLAGIAKLKITGSEAQAFSIWADGFAEKKAAGRQLGTTQNIIKTFISMFPILSSICIFSWVVFERDQTLTTGGFLAFTSAYSSFQMGLLQMSMALVTSLNVVSLFGNLKPIITTLPEVSDAKEHPGEMSGDIEISHVDFRYDADGPLILKDVSLQIKRDEFIAIVGSSGSGKSTLLRLLLGFEQPDNGVIFYDNKDLEQLDIVEVRKQLGVVLQNSKLLQGSIFDNIVGSLPLSLDDAWEAARMAGCYEDIKNMPMKMHTVVPPGGGVLSGGQRQRIIIARALAKRPRIIFFDEATSALDNETQAVVSESLERMKVTRVVIAHRLSTIRNADRIYCLDKGVVVENGIYDELMANRSFFYELAKRQMV